MPFTVETGNGVANANSYITEAQFRAHHADRGEDVTALTQAQVETACVRATDYIEKRFGRRFRGFRRNKNQGLEWPRNNAFDDDGFSLDAVPSQLVKGCAEYALRAHTLGDLAPDPALQFATREGTTVTSAGQVTRKREKVGPIEEETETASASGDFSGEFYIPPYPAADLWINELIEAPSRDIVRG